MMAYQEQEPRTRNSVDYLGVALPGDTTGIEANSAPVQSHNEIGRISRTGGKAHSVAARKSLDHLRTLRTPSQDLVHLNQGMFQDEDDE